MGKIIFWIIVFFLVLLALRLVSVHKTRNDERDRDEENRNKHDDPTRRRDDPKRRRDDAPASDAMVKCERCGVFTPKAHAVMKRGEWTCGDERCTQKRQA